MHRVQMKRSQTLLAGMAGILIVGAVTLVRFSHAGGAASAPPDAQPIPVTATRVAAHDVELYLTGIGTIQAFNTVTIRPRVDGELVKVAFHEGQAVRKGDLLLQIDQRPYQAALDNALANLAKDQAVLATAKRDLARYQETAAKGYTSRQQFETQASAVDAAAATVQADDATIENARVQLGYTDIVSPLDGVTGIRLVDQGNIVHASESTGLVVITQVRPISAIFTLPQDALPRVIAARAKGKLAVTALDGDSGATLGVGTLELIDNQIDPATGTLRLKAEFPNDQDTLWPGQFVTIRLRLGDVPDGLTLPTRAIQRGPKGFFVFVIPPDGKVEVRPVAIGQDDNGQTLVTSGLLAGDRIVVDGQARLQQGALARVIDEQAGTGSGVEGAAAQNTEGAMIQGAIGR
jgi:multidrug efflux system membrane fusion protein